MLSHPSHEIRTGSVRAAGSARRAQPVSPPSLTLRSVEECRAFLRDLCTPAELQAMADRWAVVEYLRRGLPYREIHRHTGVSVTTIGRVARFLALGQRRLCARGSKRLDGASHMDKAARTAAGAPQARGAEVRTPDRPVARPAGALRPEALARQGSAHGLRREHAARCAVRARRRHPGSGAGRRLRSGARGAERARREAPRAGRARRAGALRDAAHARFRALPARARGAGRRRSYRRACDSLRGKRIATTYPFLLEQLSCSEREIARARS